MSKKANLEAAAFAETILSADYRMAQNQAFDDDPTDFVEKKDRAEDLIAQAIATSMGRRALKGKEFAWEGRRLAAIGELKGEGIGRFVDVFRNAKAERGASPKSAEELAPGERLVVQTNNHIVSLDRVVTDPMDYFEESLDWIEQRQAQGQHYIGPENYATVFKLFADKTRELNMTRLNQEDLRGYIDRCLDGFVVIAERDKPNVIEMTNVNVAVNAMPNGSIDRRFAEPLVKLNLGCLRDYDIRTMRPLMAGLAKLDLADTGEASGELVDLMLRQGYEMERSDDMRIALRAIANLPKSPTAEMAFSTLVEKRNDIEQVLGVAEIEEVTAALRKIVDQLVDDPKLRDSAIDIADKGITSALGQLRALKDSSALAPGDLGTFRAIVQRAVINRNEM